ncbi:hypothetical protein D7027_20960 [Ochrobactrum intermedium]|uniref:hypothetical protein n=1 Tax=Brucella intermedia TaxID=94625 RepID=UPI00128C1C57|nr:hypothetical protein [Brucella intermedia]MPR64263.1 hypothetical protein [Brucella intermedia]
MAEAIERTRSEVAEFWCSTVDADVMVSRDRDLVVKELVRREENNETKAEFKRVLVTTMQRQRDIPKMATARLAEKIDLLTFVSMMIGLGLLSLE